MKSISFFLIIQERERETSEDWIKRKIIGEIINPGETLAENIMENLIRRSVLSGWLLLIV